MKIYLMRITTNIAELLGTGTLFIIDYEQIKNRVQNPNWRSIFTYNFKP